MKTITRQLLWLPIALLLLSLSQLQAEETVTVEISYGYDSGGTATIFDKTLNQQLVLTENKAQVIKGHQIVVNATGKEGRTFYSGQWWPTGKSERNPIKALPLELTADVNLSVSLTFQYLASYSIRGEAGGTLKGYFLYKSDPDAWFPDEVPFDSPKRFFLDGNDTFVFKAQPSEGYTLKAWYLNGELVQGESTLTYKVVRPRTSIDVEVEFSKEVAEAKVTMVQPDVTQGSMTAHYTNDATKEVTDGASVAKDTQVTFVVTPKEGYEMASWKVDDQPKELESADPNKLTLTVTADLKVEPVLKAKVVKYTVTLGEWSNTKGFFYAYYGSEMTKVESGASLPAGTAVSFQVDAAEDYELDYWMVDDVKSDDTSNPLVITLSKNVKVVPVMKEKAAPQPTDAKITMVQPEHGKMTASYYDDVEFETFDVIDGGRVNLGVNVTFVVKPNEGYEMDYWMVDDERQELDTETPNETIITVTGDLKVEPILKKKAAPQPTMYTVTLTQPDATQGTMTAHYTDDATKAVTTGASVEKDTQVTFVVTPAEGYEMDSWKVNTETKPLESADPNQLTLTVTADLKVEPVLKAKAPVNPTKATLTITREGIGGTVSGKYVTPDEKTFSIWEGNTKQVPLGSTVTLTANLTEGFEVTYTNNGNPAPAEALSADGKVYTFIVNGDATVVAKIDKKQVTGEFTVKCVADPADGGVVSASTAEGPITSETKVAAGTLITVNATAKENFEVDQWFLNDKELESQKGKESHTFALTENVTIKVTFKSTLPPAEYAVTVEPVLPSAEAGAVKLFYKDGSVVASGTKVVTGSEMYVEVKPADKYELETLQVGETKIPAGDEKLIKQADGGFKYAFTVTEATKIQATFKLINAVEQLTAGQVAVYVTNGGTRLDVAGAAEGAEVRLYDYTGQLLLASTEHALDISALPAGSYIVLVGNYTTRIVK
ncbi:T9SS type A sorting domain-containing protein [Porphyromonas uenonis]|uniref:T9SS type A sorting domain-containing protein n=1 Tax=Porphyromonas uenonis TaxID=281920 RepID=UPI0026715E9E|nr:T9SS type A sorting domain-containing protein [Porphyromonas uenonis]